MASLRVASTFHRRTSMTSFLTTTIRVRSAVCLPGATESSGGGSHSLGSASRAGTLAPLSPLCSPLSLSWRAGLLPRWMVGVAQSINYCTVLCMYGCCKSDMKVEVMCTHVGVADIITYLPLSLSLNHTTFSSLIVTIYSTHH